MARTSVEWADQLERDARYRDAGVGELVNRAAETAWRLDQHTESLGEGFGVERGLAFCGALLILAGRKLEREKAGPPRCPDTVRCSDDVVGCGSLNVTGPDRENLFDCLDCGMWFEWPERPLDENGN
jgi:hypothetical protein